MPKVLTVLITGVGGGGVGHEIIKSLKMVGLYRLIGTDMSKTSFGLSDTDASYYVPRASDNAYIPRLLEICTKEKVDVIVPGSEPELARISTSRHEFIEKRILPLINTQAAISICMDKHKTMKFLYDHGFYTPKTVSSTAFLEQLETLLPVIVKPTISSGGSANVYLAQTVDELLFFSSYLENQGLVPIIQEYVGSYTEEYTVGVLTDMHPGPSKIIGSLAVKRFILSGLSNRIRVKNLHPNKIKGDLLVVSSGISQGEVGNYPEVRAECERIALALQSKGPMNFQCRKDGAKIYVFEINPRFSGTTHIRALMGYNEPDILIRSALLEERIEPVVYRYGVVARALEERCISDGT